jgi:oxygen-dependent protoporphyrinogen oxidase
MIGTFAPGASRALSAIEYAPVSVVVAAYRRSDVAHPIAGFGCLVPKVERRKILGTLFSSSMFEGRAPAGTVILTTFVGGRRNPEVAALADADLVTTVRGDLAALIGASGEPLWTEVIRWPQAIPQYDLGHRERLARLDEAEAVHAGLFFCANYRGGVSVSDCVKNGHAIGEKVAAHADRERLATVA